MKGNYAMFRAKKAKPWVFVLLNVSKHAEPDYFLPHMCHFYFYEVSRYAFFVFKTSLVIWVLRLREILRLSGTNLSVQVRTAFFNASLKSSLLQLHLQFASQNHCKTPKRRVRIVSSCASLKSGNTVAGNFSLGMRKQWSMTIRWSEIPSTPSEILVSRSRLR